MTKLEYMNRICPLCRGCKGIRMMVVWIDGVQYLKCLNYKKKEVKRMDIEDNIDELEELINNLDGTIQDLKIYKTDFSDQLSELKYEAESILKPLKERQAKKWEKELKEEMREYEGAV
ncbi:MAG: hypothetical protein LBL91_06125 [Lachnospiraceae bacterium]|jgi:peptidoglycan hydrolase CwlO-like protein|nr:hypothetical protein [Lachnospiraceae bacterium]